VRKPKILLLVATGLLIAVGVARSTIWGYHIKDLAYGSLYLFTRIDGLCIGVILALLMRINPHFPRKYITAIVLFLAAVNLGFYILNDRHSLTLPYLGFVGYTTFAILFGILVYEGVTRRSKIIRILFENKVLKFFGKISYGFYVYHWPVNILLFAFFQDLFYDQFHFPSRIAEISSAILITVAAILISVISYRYFEQFFLKFKKRFT
jgi:peptidoglycan/LPS O-acetylase OafA/YrhL